MSRIPELLDELRAEILDLRIQAAWLRDGSLTRAETIAMLEVYQEAGK